MWTVQVTHKLKKQVVATSSFKKEEKAKHQKGIYQNNYPEKKLYKIEMFQK